MSSPEMERFAIAIQLHETGLALQRQNLRRRHPDLSEDEVDALMADWLADRPLDHSPT